MKQYLVKPNYLREYYSILNKLTLRAAIFLIVVLIPSTSLSKGSDSALQLYGHELTVKKISDLELLGKIWSFLEFNSLSASRMRNPDWEQALLTLIPSYVAASSVEQRDLLLLELVKLVDLSPNEHQPSGEAIYLAPKPNWLTPENFSQELFDQLDKAYRFRKTRFVPRDGRVDGLTDFGWHSKYVDIDATDPAVALLVLFRFWSIYNYYSPLRHMKGNGWDEILKEQIPFFVRVNSKIDYVKSIRKLVSKTNDSAAIFYDRDKSFEKWLGEFSSPIIVRFIDNKLIVVGFYDSGKNSMGLSIGDHITHINGRSVEEIVNERKDYYPAATFQIQLRKLSYDILRSNSEDLRVTFTRNGKSSSIKLTQSLTKRHVNEFGYPSLKYSQPYKLLGNNVAYIQMKFIDEWWTVTPILQSFINASGLIFDLRGEHREHMVYSFAKCFWDEPKEFFKLVYMAEKGVGELTEKSRQWQLDRTTNEESPLCKRPVVVLVNEYTKGTSEFLALVLQQGTDTTVVGSETAHSFGSGHAYSIDGKSSVDLAWNYSVKITTQKLQYLDTEARETESIRIDRIVKPTVESLVQGRDLLIEEAIKIINSSSSN